MRRIRLYGLYILVASSQLSHYIIGYITIFLQRITSTIGKPKFHLK
jgi:hypothetical protein